MAGNPRAGRKTATFEFDIVDYENRIIRGPVTTDRVDRDREIIDHESVKSAFADFLDSAPALVILHDLLAPAGKVNSYTTGMKGQNRAVYIESQVARSRDPRRDCEFAWEMVEQGVFNAFSFQYEWEKKVEEKGPDGEPVKRVYIRDIWEVSLLPVPSNKDAIIEERIKSLRGMLPSRQGRQKELITTAIKSLTTNESETMDDEDIKKLTEALGEQVNKAVKSVGENFSKQLEELNETLTETLAEAKAPRAPEEPDKGSGPDEITEEKLTELLISETGQKTLISAMKNAKISATLEKALAGIPKGDEDEDEDLSDVKMVTASSNQGSDAWEKFKQDIYQG